MTMHAQPLIPGVGPFVRDAPEDRHAERVVRDARIPRELRKQVRGWLSKTPRSLPTSGPSPKMSYQS